MSEYAIRHRLIDDIPTPSQSHWEETTSTQNDHVVTRSLNPFRKIEKQRWLDFAYTGVAIVAGSVAGLLFTGVINLAFSLLSIK